MSTSPTPPQQPTAPQYAAPQYAAPLGPAGTPPGSMPRYAPGPPPGDRAGYTGGLWSMILGIAAVVLSFLSLNLLPAIAALILGIINVRKPAGKTFSIVGLITGGVSMFIGFIVLIVVWIPLVLAGGLLAAIFGAAISAGNVPDFDVPSATSPPPIVEEFTPPAELEFREVETPCYSYDGPQHFVLNTSSTAIAACASSLELWGEWKDQGIVKATGVGAVFGAIEVEPLREDGVLADLPVRNLDALRTYIEESDFITGNGSVIVSTTPIQLDDSPAILVEVDSSEPTTEGRWVIAAQAPQAYSVAGGTHEFFLITVTSAEFSAPEVLDELLDSWDWE